MSTIEGVFEGLYSIKCPNCENHIIYEEAHNMPWGEDDSNSYVCPECETQFYVSPVYKFVHFVVEEWQ